MDYLNRPLIEKKKIKENEEMAMFAVLCALLPQNNCVFFFFYSTYTNTTMYNALVPIIRSDLLDAN